MEIFYFAIPGLVLVSSLTALAIPQQLAKQLNGCGLAAQCAHPVFPQW